jgi:hypothetical protein
MFSFLALSLIPSIYEMREMAMEFISLGNYCSSNLRLRLELKGNTASSYDAVLD